MKIRTLFSKRMLSIVLCIAMLMAYLPLSTVAADVSNANFNRVVDEYTMNNWTKYFDLNNLDTTNAGGVWTDKSVFTDASAFPNSVTMLDDSKNFLTALSAIATNKEVVGYSTVPTDTVFILDLSGSMSSASVTQLVNATNAAIARLLKENNNNRVGVVLYSGSSSNRTYANAVARLLPIDRYTTTDSQGRYIQFNNSTVSVLRNRVSGTGSSIVTESKSHGGATYIQAGLWEAYKMFNEVPDSEIVIGDNNWQSGEYRMPIVVLMSDGAPTLGASTFYDVENQTYGWNSSGADFGDGNDSNLTVGQGFLVQLTASYIKNRIENKYRIHDENGAGRSLFYTLGFNLNSISNQTARNTAISVLNPDASTVTDSLWASYNHSNTGSIQVSVESRNGGQTNITVDKNSFATSKSYVDRYFSAASDGLTAAFDDIVKEILLQSRYYPTHLEGGSPDFSGYIEFTDTLGEYMEVKHVNGILLGETLFDGHMMASKLADTSDDGLGTPERPTALGDEFIRAVKTRLGIADTADAQTLVAKAYADGQLKYVNASNWSNYIAWYAKADNTYAGFYDKDGTEPVPTDAVYINRSYGFLGETTGSIKNSDMMYMSVIVSTNIETGEQTVRWNIPAALVPMITYMVSLDGTSVDSASDVSISVENADDVAPIRLIYETGLRSDLNEFNITRITGNSITDAKKTDERHVAADGHTRLFWNNSYDITASTHDNHITAMAEFTPNKENERFYYTFDSAVYKKSGQNYVLVGQNETLDENGEYYHRRYVFKEDAADKKPVFFFERMSKASIRVATWQDDFETLDHQRTGAYVVPKGTPARELDMYDEQKSTNASNSAEMVFHPYLSEQNNVVYVDMNLGNNGLLSVTPATGIKISKTVDIFETGTSDTFKFRINASASGSFDSWITALDATPTGAATTAQFVNGVYEVELKKDQTIWITGIPAGTTYTVEEISDNADYKVKSVHVNGLSTGYAANGTVSQYLVDDISFVNTAVGEGDLVISKQVVDVDGNPVDISEAIKFTAEVTLTDAANNAISGTFASSAGNISLQNGKFTVTLSDGESFVIRDIPEETKYSVSEINIPDGFVLDVEKSRLTGVVDAATNDQALIVNTYRPVGTNGQDVDVEITKEISGNRTNWLDGESYTFNLERLDAARAVGSVIATTAIDADDADKSHLFSLSGEDYTAAGTYYYRVSEVKGSQGGVTYDTAERRFSVVVADSDMDGDLEIIAVNNEMNTTVSGSWTVKANFNNVYAPAGTATATVNIQKELSGHALSGYQFALYDADPSVDAEANQIVKSGLTNAAGTASIILSYSADDAGQTYTYYLAEVNRGQTIHNIKYAETVYKVEVIVRDNLDGTISAETIISGLAQGTTVPTFTNTYVPSASDFVTISGKKEIEGDRVLNANEFEFVLEAVTPGAPMPAVTTVKNASDGSFAFPAIEFTDGHKGNSYVYKVTEIDNNIGGFAYDTTVYTVTVTVTDNGDQTVTATAVINNGTADVDDITFKNTYDAENAKVKLSATKILTGKVLQAGEFEFVITRLTENAPMPFLNSDKNTTSNDENGVIDLGTIEFEKKGVYVYTVTETDLADSRYDCDQSVYTVTITVTDNSQGVLSAKAEYTKNGMPSAEIVFRNGFVPAPIDYDIHHIDFVGDGEKALAGRPVEEGEFEFVLINAINGQQIGQTVKNDANGKFKFPVFKLSVPGIHHYKIVEVVGDEKGVSYDTSSFHIRLEVNQDENGLLSVTSERLYKGVITKQEVAGVLTEVTTYENITDGGKIKFNNTYTADPAYVTFEAAKSITGRDLVDGEFKFDLHKTGSDFAYNEETLVQDDVILKLQTNGSGSIIFAPEVFREAGTYYYVIVEDELDAKGVKADRTVHKIEVVVTDNLEGSLVAKLKVNGEDITGSTADTIKFLNTYQAAATEIVIKGTKTLSGRDLVAEEFSFELYDKDNSKLETVKNAADGSFAFKAIPVDKAGEYVYTVRELQGNAEGISYDAAVYTVKVSVTDNLDGTFKVEYTYLKGEESAESVIFANIYTAPEPDRMENPKTGDTVNLTLLFVLVILSGLGLAVTIMLGRKQKKHKLSNAHNNDTL